MGIIYFIYVQERKTTKERKQIKKEYVYTLYYQVALSQAKHI